MKPIPSLLIMASFSALVLTACGASSEADYPTKEIDLTIPLGAGGATDLAARAMAPALGDELGEPVNATNREGANQITGVSYVVQAQPDGYSLLADGAASSTLQSILDDLPYEWDDRTFIAHVASGAHVYAVGKGTGIEDMDSLVDEIKDNPKDFKIAWIGGTATSDFATLQLLDAIDVDPNDVTLVPFTGTGDAMQAAAAGDVDLASGGSSAIGPLYSSGDLVPLALTDEDPNFPEIPLTEDAGYPELDIRYWVGLSGPADMPENMVEKLGESLDSLQDDDSVQDSFEKLGMSVELMTGEEFDDYIQDEASEYEELDSLLNE